MRLLCSILAVVYIIFSSNSFAQSDVFIGISYNPVQDGIELTQVVRNSPAEIAGLEVGDVLISADGKKLTSSDSLASFLTTKAPGDRIKLAIQRCKTEKIVPLILGKRSDYEGPMRTGGRTDFPKDIDSILPYWRNAHGVDLFFEGLSKFGMDKTYEALANSFKTEFESYSCFYTLDRVAAVMLEPASCPAAAQDVVSRCRFSEGQPNDIFAGALSILDCEPANSIDINRVSSYDEIIALVEVCNDLIYEAFIDLTTDELQNIADLAPFLLNTFCRTVYIHSDENEELVESYYELITSTKKIHYEKLLLAGKHLASIVETDFNKMFLKVSQGEGANLNSDILLDKLVAIGHKDSAGLRVPLLGRLVVSGYEGRIYTDDAAIWIDLGGDDVYLNHCGGTPYTLIDNTRHRFESGRVGLLIDLGGNDKYLRTTPGSIGSGFCGAGCLIDLDGDDLYSGNRLAQGASFCGTGLLYDRSGNDNYLSDECSQGFSAFGCAVLFDNSGDDLFKGSRYVQGVGVTKALGALVDRGGNDNYVASFKHPNGYGNENTWDGWSQGVGIGFRSVSAGGIGVLYDAEGDDLYEAGNFSQACGYFFGMGILHDSAGDDEYRGNRYVQGAGAHQAASCFFDFAGNDNYYGNEAVNQGGAWDIVSAWFFDFAGNDRYRGTSLSQGGAAQSAIAVCIDFDGEDVYEASSVSNGSGGALDYHTSYADRNIGLHADLGGGKDDYSATLGKRRNNWITFTGDDKAGGDGVFIDR